MRPRNGPRSAGSPEATSLNESRGAVWSATFCDDLHDGADSVGPIQGALGPAHDLDALDVDGR